MEVNEHTLELAKLLAKTSHFDQKYGVEDYFDNHIEPVVKSLMIHDLPLVYLVVGYLHDAVEDTELTLETVENLFGVEVKESVDAITKRPDENRQEYLIRCRSNKIARLVKLHDAMFNATSNHINKSNPRFNYYLETIASLKIEK